MVGTTKVRDAVGRQHFAVFHHVNVASEKHEASSHIIIFSGKPCNLVLVPPIYAGLLLVPAMYVCMFHTEVCELINVLPPGPAYLYNNNNTSISSRWFDSQMTHLPTLTNSVLTIQHACPQYLMEGYTSTKQLEKMHTAISNIIKKRKWQIHMTPV